MRNSLFVIAMTLMFSNVACIKDGALPPEVPDAAVPLTQPDACPTPVVDATVTPTVDAMVPVVDASAPMPDATVPVPDATPPAPDAAPVSPDASVPDAACPPPPPPAPVCHGLFVDFTAADLATLDHCVGWPASGSGVTLTPALEVVGGDGVCSITCNKLVTGETVVPNQVSGIWLPGATADVPRWYQHGCRRLPDHPVGEADQAGGAWDGRCDLY